MKRKWLASLTAGIFLLNVAARADEPVRAFGLEFTVISNAVIATDSEFAALRVSQTNPPDCDGSIIIDTNEVAGTNYPFGVSVHLGEAQSGVYIYPADAGCRADNMSMWADAYGSVNDETNRLISSIKGTRVYWGYYRVKVDFTSLGATGYTYQVWSHGTKMMHVTNHGPCSSISTYNIEDRDPRANPFYLTESGPAALIEFPYGTQFMLEDESRTTAGDRILIIAEGVTNQVDYVSRVDVFGSENLPAFAINSARIGMFGLPHAALGDANFIASSGRLTAERSQDTNRFRSGTGVLVDFKNPVTRWQTRTEPFALEETNAQFMLSATGLRSSEEPYTPQYFGPAGFTRSSGVLHLSGDFTYLRASNCMLRVFLGDAPSGTILGANGSSLATLADTNRVIGWSAALETFSFSLAEATPVTGHDGTLLEGDRFEFAPYQNEMHIGQLYDANVVAQGTPRYTIISESTEEAPVPELKMQIDRAPSGLVVSWPHRLWFYLVSRNKVFDDVYDGVNSTEYRDFHWYTSVDPTNDMRVYSLRHYYYYYINP